MSKEELRQFDSIRPFEPEELPAVFERLLSNEQFRQVAGYVMPGVPVEVVKKKMLSCRTNLEFQLAFCYDIVENILQKTSRGYDADFSAVDLQNRYTFVSNHRDIVMDSALLDKLLVDAGSPTTCEIAIGDNLLTLPWVKDLVRVNKSFIVERSLPMRQALAASKRLADYMHFVISSKNDNIWIAQREGRAKDADDRTQESILKMMTMGGEGSIVERLVGLHIVPTAISYEYDPCDYLKARELQLRRDVEDWHKAPGDDVTSMRTGIMGYKGRVHYKCAPCIDEWLKGLDADMSKAEFFSNVARHIDEEIFKGYCLYPSNYIALDMLDGAAHTQNYTKEEKQEFEAYVEGQLAKIDIANRDDSFLRRSMLTMYANPARNKLKTLRT